MSQFLYRSLVIIIFLCLFGCRVNLNPSQKPKYKEDLSVYRPVYQTVNIENKIISSTDTSLIFGEEDSININSDIKPQLDSLLISIAENNRAKGFIQAYTIQVYTGNNRKIAEEAKLKVYQLLPVITPKLSYIQPNYKVKVGIYYDKLDAYSTHSYLKKSFPTAIIIPERIRMPSR